ncbi:response regulator [[Pasteurella] aerogenes]|nr:response regulator [[Pasteurella] aerogenes]MCU9999312.1 response regulator transcription factor [[Pasteurella] aerogenes]MDY2796490.1 response regulator [[Pasteurella] aerogenes]
MIVHIVDDDETILDAMQFLLQPLNVEVITWQNSQQFIQQADLHQEGVVLLDIRMPYLDGQQVHQYLRQYQSTLAVIIMTAHGDVPLAVAELKNGAVDFLTKPLKFDHLQQVLTQAQEISQKKGNLHQISAQFQQLTPKEKALVSHLLSGATNKQIADLLNVSVRTVEVHRASIMQKMQAETLAQLVYKITLLNSA